MSTTILPPLNEGVDARFAEIYAAYESAWGDYDKADEEENEIYYGGLIDAYYHVLVTFGAIDPEPERKPCPMTYAHAAHTYTVNMGEPFACPGKREQS